MLKCRRGVLGELPVPRELHMANEIDSQSGGDARGIIFVEWPYTIEDDDFSSRWRRILPLLREHGFCWHSLTSSSFVGFSGNRDSADQLQAKISEIDSIFTVRWDRAPAVRIPSPETRRMRCPKCGKSAEFIIPYHVLVLDEAGVDELEAVILRHPDRLKLERLSDRQILWYFPDLYGGPWNGWDHRYGVCRCHSCGLRTKHDFNAKWI
jgi:hypothetical protein